jgi:spermidine/putrescine transport system permease protein
MGTAVPAIQAAPRPLSQRIARVFDRWLLPIYAVMAVLYLMLPVAVMIMFSFNDPVGKFNLVWHQFSLAAWQNPLAPPGLGSAVLNSLIVAFLATIFATILGTLIALALVRHRFRGRSATNLLIFLPMSTPEIVLGSSLLTLFIATNQYAFVPEGTFYPLGLHTVLIAHIMFNISFVVVTVKARVEGFPRNLEEAGLDLYANEWTVFWKVTFPLILPGILAAALLAFSLSIDDFVVTNFTAGQATTFPLWIYGAQKTGVPVQANVIGSIIFLSAVGLVVVSVLLQRRSSAGR